VVKTDDEDLQILKASEEVYQGGFMNETRGTATGIQNFKFGASFNQVVQGRVSEFAASCNGKVLQTSKETPSNFIKSDVY